MDEDIVKGKGMHKSDIDEKKDQQAIIKRCDERIKELKTEIEDC